MFPLSFPQVPPQRTPVAGARIVSRGCPSRTSAADDLQHAGRRECCLGRLGALVLLRAGEPGAIETLCLVLEREHPEADGLPGVESDTGESVGRGRGDEFEVGGSATDDDAEGDHGIRPVLESGLADDRKLEGARSGVLDDRRAGGLEHAAGAGEEARDAREAFITGAGALVMPVVGIDGSPIGDGKPGPVARRLRALYIENAQASII